MKRRLLWAIALIAILLLTIPARAGGWVVITLDELPADVHAGQTVNLGFMVRQHGRTPIDTVSPVMLATNQETGEKIRVEAEKAGGTGHFSLDIVFPSQGIWEWQITAEPFPQTTYLVPITVLPSAAPNPSASTPAGANDVQAVLRWAGFGLLAAAAVAAVLSARPLAARLVSGRREPEGLTSKPSD